MMDPNTNLNRVWPRWVILTLTLFFIIFAYYGCCCEDDDPGETVAPPAAQIVIDDSRAAVWMTFDNDNLDTDCMGTADCPGLCSDETRATGSCSTPYADNTVHGVMFQFGMLHGTDDDWEPSLEKVEIITAIDPNDYSLDDEATINDPISLDYGEFDWLDINPHEDCIIDAYHAYALFLNEQVELTCDQEEWDTCRRNRSLHASLKADGGLLTYWSGNNGYTVDAEKRAGSSHPSYTFNLNDSIDVDVWKEGCLLADYDNVVQVILYVDGASSTPGSIFDDSPVDGVVTVP